MASESCVFCDIIKGDKKASIVYENETVLAFMDQRQANPGHVLVIPKEHFRDIYSLPETIGPHIMGCLIKVSQAVKEAFDAEGLNIWQSNGRAGGQEVYHVHFHVHPRKFNDTLPKIYDSEPMCPSSDELDEYAQRIRNFL